jgi:hypothetical protein
MVMSLNKIRCIVVTAFQLGNNIKYYIPEVSQAILYEDMFVGRLETAMF